MTVARYPVLLVTLQAAQRRRTLNCGLTPLLAERLQIRAPEIFRLHRNPKFHHGIECKEPWLGQRWYFGRIVQINHKSATAAPVVLGEIGHLGLDGFQYLLYLRPDAAVANRSVERLKRKLNVH